MRVYILYQYLCIVLYCIVCLLTGHEEQNHKDTFYIQINIARKYNNTKIDRQHFHVGRDLREHIQLTHSLLLLLETCSRSYLEWGRYGDNMANCTCIPMLTLPKRRLLSSKAQRCKDFFINHLNHVVLVFIG